MGKEKELNKALVSRIRLSLTSLLPYLLVGGGARMCNAGVTVPLETIDSVTESAERLRRLEVGWAATIGDRGKKVSLRKLEVMLAMPPTMSPIIAAHARKV